MRFILLLLPLLLVLCTCSPKLETAEPPQKFPKKVRNIVLLIGDGMGLSQVTAGLYSNNNRLNLERCPVVGLIKTHSANSLITDSAAGSTAFSTGKKTFNGAVAVNTDSVPLPTILELAEGEGLATGMIVTSEITDATPACFIAHQPNRNMYEEIAEDFLKTDIDLFIGGGENYFDNRRDGNNLLFVLKARGYSIYNQTIPFSDVHLKPGKKMAYFTAPEKPPFRVDGRDFFLPAVDFGLNMLNGHSEKGFFLMIESSEIDEGGHRNHIDLLVEEMIEFDEVVGKVLDFAAQDQHTLVIITADHETGGLGINAGSAMRKGKIRAGFTTGGHTATMVPVFAYGPGSEAFGGIYENTEIFYKMIEALKLSGY